MSSQLERYLRNIAAELHGLPEDRREDEIEEIHEHLLAYAEKQKAAGKSDEEAINAAMAQFGSPREVGRGIARSVNHAALRVPVFVATSALVSTVVFLGIVSEPPMSGIAVSLFAGLFLLQVLIIGLCFGLIARRPAILWVGVFFTLNAFMEALNMIILTWRNAHWLHPAHSPVLFVFEQEFLTILHVPIAMAGAWIGAKIAERVIDRTKGQVAG